MTLSSESLDLDATQCRRACLARDARFDGLFFAAVKTTAIFCRPVCPAPAPKSANVAYFRTALAASLAGFRPCLRCRPESAPDSPAWRGVKTTLARAIRLIDSGEWRDQNLPEFAARLGVSGRYLRQLFRAHLGVSPRDYARFRRALFAKRLLQDTALPVEEVALMAGFGSARRCQAACVNVLGMNPRQIRRASGRTRAQGLTLWLSYRPPYHWPALRDFYAARRIPGLEIVADNAYGRGFVDADTQGAFVATHVAERCGFSVQLWLDRPHQALAIVQRIRRLLDLDADTAAITAALRAHPCLAALQVDGLRLPGVWTPFEAGARAVLGQQVSVAAARQLVTQLVERLGRPWQTPHHHIANVESGCGGITRLFPEAAAVRDADLDFLRMPGKRREALRALATHIAGGGGGDPATWLGIAGIGPWTRDYAAFRLGDPDIFLASDLGVQRALAQVQRQSASAGPQPSAAAPAALDFRPWGSYATLQLWNLPAPSAAAATTGKTHLATSTGPKPAGVPSDNTRGANSTLCPLRTHQ